MPQCTGQQCNSNALGQNNCGNIAPACGRIISNASPDGYCACAGCANCPAVAPVPGLGPTIAPPVYFNYSQLLLPAAIGVQTACAAATNGGNSGAQPPPNSGNCSDSPDRCLNDPTCRGCFQILRDVNSGRENISAALANSTCTAPDTVDKLLALTGCQKNDRSTPSPESTALVNAWRCVESLPAGRECIASMGRLVAAGDQSWGSWFAVLTSPSGRALMTAVSSSTSLHQRNPLCLNIVEQLQGYRPPLLSAASVFPRVATCEISAQICVYTPACKACLVGDPTAESVAIQYTPACKLPLAVFGSTCAGTDYVNYLECHDVIKTNNIIVYATSCFGALSLLGSLAVLAVIHGHRKDLRSLRERILVGVFFGNALYSLANTIPVGLENDDPKDCGTNTLGGDTAVNVRGLWFWAKFTMVMYELFVIYASVVALKSGSINMKRKHELWAHAACLTIGIFFYISFILAGGSAYRDYTDATTYEAQQAARGLYDWLVEGFVQAWIGFFCVLLVTWLYQVHVFRGLKQDWAGANQESEEDIARDLWKTSDPYVQAQRKKKRQLMELITTGYDEVAKPLAPYVLTFIAFAIPAVIMATNWCKINSAAASPSVNCQHVAEMFLSLRTLATVGVYFRTAETRAELYAGRTLLGKIGARLKGQVLALCGVHTRGAGVRYRATDEVKMIPANGDSESGSEGDPDDLSYASALDADTKF